MAILYLDSNIISYLHSPEDYQQAEWYNTLSPIRKCISKPENEIATVYSPVHLVDIRKGYLKDKARALDKLKFLSELTNNICLLKYFASFELRFESRDPTEFFFTDTENNSEFHATGENEINLLSLIEGSQVYEKHKDKKVDYEAVKSQLAILDIELKRTKADPNVYSLMCDLTEFIQTLISNGHLLYKSLRDKAREETGVADRIAGKEDPLTMLDELLKETEFGQRVDKVMKESFRLDPNNREDIITSQFMNLDFLGFKRDKLKENHGFMSLATDASHCFYASHCDIFVTNDGPTSERSHAVFRYLKIDVKVYDVRQFENWCAPLGNFTHINRLHSIKHLYLSLALTPNIFIW